MENVKKKAILAIGAHPDDIEIGCGGTIKKHVLKGDEVYYVIASNGEKGGKAEERINEARKAAQLMGIKGIDLLNLRDTFISHDGETVHLLDEIMKKRNPTIIYVHSLKDYHQDHMNIAKAALSSSRAMKNSILCYEAPSTTLDFTPTAFYDISETFESKIECINQFISQEKRNYLEREAIVNLSKFRGKVIGVEYAEAFEVVRLIEW
jgi:LmbE family N-acetylglucosaminyl deacetylase